MTLEELDLALQSLVLGTELDEHQLDGVRDLRMDLHDLCMGNALAANEARAGNPFKFDVDHLVRLGIEGTIEAHRVVEDLRNNPPVVSEVYGEGYLHNSDRDD
jgi:hypothetical protein